MFETGWQGLQGTEPAAFLLAALSPVQVGERRAPQSRTCALHTLGEEPQSRCFMPQEGQSPGPSLWGNLFPLLVDFVQRLRLTTDFLPYEFQVYSLLFRFCEHSKLERALHESQVAWLTPSPGSVTNLLRDFGRVLLILPSLFLSL